METGSSLAASGQWLKVEQEPLSSSLSVSPGPVPLPTSTKDTLTLSLPLFTVHFLQTEIPQYAQTYLAQGHKQHWNLHLPPRLLLQFVLLCSLYAHK